MRIRLYSVVFAVTLVVDARAQQPTVARWDVGAMAPTEHGYEVLALDLDGDGLPERIVSQGEHHAIGIQKGTTDGQPSPVQVVDVSLDLRPLAAADFNLDGALDIAGAEGVFFAVCDVAILLGDGQGGLLPPQTSTSTGTLAPEYIVAADVHSDGTPDVAVSSRNTSAVSFLEGDGTGQLKPAVVTLGWPGFGTPVGLAAAEVTGDGRIDLLAGGQNELTILPSNGLGGFAATISLPEQGTLEDVRTADVDSDGRADVLMALPGGKLGVRLQQVAGALSAETQVVMASGMTQGSERLGVGHLNGDGLLDVVASFGAGGLVGALGNGAGGFTPRPLASLITEGHPAIADLDFDGRGDVATVLGQPDGDGFLGVARGDGQGGFLVAARPDNGPVPARALAAADANGDGLPDVAAALFEADTLAIVLGDGHGGFLPPQLLPNASEPVDLAWADLNLDGMQDLLAQLAGTDKLRAYVADSFGADGFDPPKDTSSLLFPVALAVGDMLEDGKPDVVVGGSFNGIQTSLAIHIGTGSGSFIAGTAVAGVDVYALTLGDVDGDGSLDVITASNGNLIQVRRGDGAGGLAIFPESLILPEPFTSVSDMAVADLDADGKAEVVIAGNELAGGGNDGLLHRVAWFGQSIVLESTDFAVGAIDGLALGDGDGDGDVDAAVSDRLGHVIGWNWNDGQGGLAQATRFDTSGKPDEPLALDLDGNGLLDLVAADTAASELVLVHAEPSPWSDLGQALAGSAGEPVLSGAGALLAASPMRIDLTGAPPVAPVFLLFGSEAGAQPFKGGTLVPVNPLNQPLVTDSQGNVHLAWQSLPPLTSGLTLVMQVWFADAGGPKGAAASNAVFALVP